jgi:hypothetical protein
MLFIVASLVAALAVLTVALYFALNATTKIIFQTPCGIQFLMDQPPLPETPNLSLHFTPKTNFFYTAPVLVSEMNVAAIAIGYPLAVGFTNNRFTFTSSVPLRILDRELTVLPSIVNGVFVAPRYGEAQRFLNHLSISFEISQPLLDTFSTLPSGQTFTFLESTRSLLNVVIGNGPIPRAPTKVNLALNVTNAALLQLTWSEANSLHGIYLFDVSSVPSEGYVSIDLVQDKNSYQVTDLTATSQYRAAVSTIGVYDESEISIAPQTITIPTPVAPPGTTLYTIDVLTGTGLSVGNGVVFNTPNYSILNSLNLKVVDCATARWPTNLLEVSQILSVSLRFYASQRTNSLPSDARMFFGPIQTSPLLYYQYFKRVARNVADTSDSARFPQAFGSTENLEGNILANSELPFTTYTITDPEHLKRLFLSVGSGSGPPDLYMFYGYKSTIMSINNSVPCVSLYQITYKA